MKDLFRNEDTTEFVIVTIPTVLGISESGRLLAELRKEGVPARRLVVNQIINVTGEGFKERKEALAVKEAALREALAAIEGSGVGRRRRRRRDRAGRDARGERVGWSRRRLRSRSARSRRKISAGRWRCWTRTRG